MLRITLKRCCDLVSDYRRSKVYSGHHPATASNAAATSLQAASSAQRPALVGSMLFDNLLLYLHLCCCCPVIGRCDSLQRTAAITTAGKGLQMAEPEVSVSSKRQVAQCGEDRRAAPAVQARARILFMMSSVLRSRRKRADYRCKCRRDGMMTEVTGFKKVFTSWLRVLGGGRLRAGGRKG